MLEAGNSRPQQRHGAGDMRSRHGCATGSGICVIGGVVARARARSGSRNVRLDPVATIGSNRAAAAEAGNRICAGIQCAYCVRSLIKRWRIAYGRAARARIARSDYHLDAGCGLGFHSCLQGVNRTTLRGRTAPGVGRYIRRQGRVAFVGRAVEWVRRQEELHALDVPGRGAIALVHVTATDPLCAGSHSNLVGAAIVANCRANGVTSMEEIVARLGRIIAAWVPHAVMNGIVPVLIVIRVCSVPATVMRLERVMCPTNTSIGARNDDSFPFESEVPNVRRVRVSNAGLDRRRGSGTAGLQRRLLDRASLRKVIVDQGIAFDTRHVGTGSECFGKLAVSFH